jgi:DNA-directed RNA polymerase subunit RPC12/RpoP
LESVRTESRIDSKEDVCGYIPYCDASNVYKHFELAIRSRIDRCPNCNSKVFPISLIYCSKYDEYYHPDFLDYDIIEHGIGDFTYAECDGCGDHNAFGWNYHDCPYSSIEHKYQCGKCGAVFDPEKKIIIENFEDSHHDSMTDFPYYRKFR